MAIVKITFIQHAKNTLAYVMKDNSPENVVSSKDCRVETAAREFESIRKSHNGHGKVEAIHLIQSWDAKESKQLTPEAFHKMGEKLVEGHFPGHAYVIATHTDTGKTHNHIVVNPWNTETGKKVENKKFHLYQLRTLNDKIARDNGLSVINGDAKNRQARLPDVAQKINRFNGTSYLLDTMQKADFARAYSVNYDQYVAILGEFNINTVVQNKNVTYFYPGQTKGKRGSKLGKLYDKTGLDEAFASNKETFAKHPKLRAQLRREVDSLKANPSSTLQTGKNLEQSTEGHFKFGYRDLKSFQKEFVRSDRYTHPSQRELQSTFFPLEELNRARRTSIFEYCKKNKIELEKHSESLWKMKDRPYVHISEFEWSNTKNRTKGSLIDLVAAHKGVTFAQAVSLINKNPTLNLAEKKLGEVKRSFTSFYIPKAESMDSSKASRRLGNLLRYHGVPEKHADNLLSHNLAQVNSKGIIRLFSQKDDRGALEFETNAHGRWISKKQGELHSPFLSQQGKSSKVRLFMDPFTALKNKGFDPFGSKDASHSSLVLMEPHSHPLEIFLSSNPHVETIEFIPSKNHKRSRVELDLFETLRRSHPSKKIEWQAPNRSERDHGRDPSGFEL